MAAQVFKAIGGGLLSARLVVIVEFLLVFPALDSPILLPSYFCYWALDNYLSSARPRYMPGHME
jgi:hypothetical protein